MILNVLSTGMKANYLKPNPAKSHLHLSEMDDNFIIKLELKTFPTIRKRRFWESILTITSISIHIKNYAKKLVKNYMHWQYCLTL